MENKLYLCLNIFFFIEVAKPIFLCTIGEWNFYKVKVVGKMTDKNVKAYCESEGFITPCYGTSSTCTYFHEDCTPLAGLNSGCFSPFNEIVKHMCPDKKARQCPKLYGIYIFMGYKWGDLGTCGVEKESHCAQGKKAENKFALCVTKRGIDLI